MQQVSCISIKMPHSEVVSKAFIFSSKYLILSNFRSNSKGYYLYVFFKKCFNFGLFLPHSKLLFSRTFWKCWNDETWVDEMMKWWTLSCWNDEMMNLELLKWWNDEVKMMKWWNVEMLSWWNDEMMNTWDDEMMKWWNLATSTRLTRTPVSFLGILVMVL